MTNTNAQQQICMEQQCSYTCVRGWLKWMQELGLILLSVLLEALGLHMNIIENLLQPTVLYLYHTSHAIVFRILLVCYTFEYMEGGHYV